MLGEFSFSLQLSNTLFQENKIKPNLGCALWAKKINLFNIEEPRSSSRKGGLENGEKKLSR